MVLESSYQQFDQSSEGEGEGQERNVDRDETPLDSGVIIHVVPESGKTRWNHIEDLDSFFTRMYHYHQRHGFACMMLQEVLELGQFIFVISFSVFLFHCIDYSILFKDKRPSNTDKISISDAILSSKECLASMGLVTWISILVASIFWFLRVVKVLYHFVQYWDIKSFFNIALKINDNDLDNLTWHEVQKKIIEVQKEQEMCIHKRELTELDIYHRILRFKNYIVAMINKSLLPVRLKIPFFGDIIFMTQGLKYNLELLLFWGPWSPFENSWHLQEDYKKLNKRQELGRSLSKYILWIGIANLVLCPLILLWQILYSFFNYGELLKREPGALGTRMWSLYGKLYLRHFNELDHELNARLNRAYRPASKYMSMFTSPLVTVIAKNVAFIFGSIFAVFLILTFYDEDFLTVEHVFMIMTVSGSVAAICRSLVPDENLVWCPESLLTAVLAHTHYRPDSWQGQAHTQTTRSQVAQLFQYRAVHLLEELMSPLLTPYILCFHLRYKALDIVDFYRNFTIEVTGVGDICSFAQMDVRKHGNPMWQTLPQSPINKEPERPEYSDLQIGNINKYIPLCSNQYTQAEDGKTELSLIHFTLTNPEWKPPSHAENFVAALRERAKREATAAQLENNPLYASLSSVSSLGPEYNDIVSNILRSPIMNQVSMPNTNYNYTHQPTGMSLHTSINGQNVCSTSGNTAIRRNVNRAEGPLHIGEKGLLYSLQQVIGGSYQSLETSAFSSGQQEMHTIQHTVPLELTAVDMSLSTLYLHEIHHRQIRRQSQKETVNKTIWQRDAFQDLATLPEAGQERAPLLAHPDSSLRNKTS
ncbi:autophagy-related protein 9 isoform X1 [Nasonia vitripennis]|uniref:Autophagy-related protein 9 n=3 Tax=Nasonia vitripennis TaxID=7425 RepID=A0A7M7TBL2_NASVI|nr:autophagy-related protein 9 isoform X1 [Nasonia vitripennis]XP_032457187.1 autophagy-related protein 9 isoform X1 [Nasonia vitripennis]XP_032457188.1 autophagy-related protein 9 isoform X1 [Nasonia vitripennis]